MTRLRIEEGGRKPSWFSNRFFTEVEYVMRTRRSPDVLRKRAWEYAKELAQAYGYDEDEVGKEDFFDLLPDLAQVIGRHAHF